MIAPIAGIVRERTQADRSRFGLMGEAACQHLPAAACGHCAMSRCCSSGGLIVAAILRALGAPLSRSPPPAAARRHPGRHRRSPVRRSASRRGPGPADAGAVAGPRTRCRARGQRYANGREAGRSSAVVLRLDLRRRPTTGAVGKGRRPGLRRRRHADRPAFHCPAGNLPRARSALYRHGRALFRLLDELRSMPLGKAPRSPCAAGSWGQDC